MRLAVIIDARLPAPPCINARFRSPFVICSKGKKRSSPLAKAPPAQAASKAAAPNAAVEHPRTAEAGPTRPQHAVPSTSAAPACSPARGSPPGPSAEPARTPRESPGQRTPARAAARTAPPSAPGPAVADKKHSLGAAKRPAPKARRAGPQEAVRVSVPTEPAGGSPAHGKPSTMRGVAARAPTAVVSAGFRDKPSATSSSEDGSSEAEYAGIGSRLEQLVAQLHSGRESLLRLVDEFLQPRTRTHGTAVAFPALTGAPAIGAQSGGPSARAAAGDGSAADGGNTGTQRGLDLLAAALEVHRGEGARDRWPLPRLDAEREARSFARDRHGAAGPAAGQANARPAPAPAPVDAETERRFAALAAAPQALPDVRAPRLVAALMALHDDPSSERMRAFVGSMPGGAELLTQLEASGHIARQGPGGDTVASEGGSGDEEAEAGFGYERLEDESDEDGRRAGGDRQGLAGGAQRGWGAEGGWKPATDAGA